MYPDVYDIPCLILEDVNSTDKYRIMSYDVFILSDTLSWDSSRIWSTDGNVDTALRLRTAEFMPQSGQKRIDFCIEKLQKYKTLGAR